LRLLLTEKFVNTLMGLYVQLSPFACT